MRFTIVTPSFRSSNWLRLCIASVADQDVEHEHVVQDSCSDDGTLEWLPHDPRVIAVIEKDRGMYDAVNRGLRRARGELLAYLNCDEQYLPGALRRVSECFDRRPDVDVVFGDCLVTDSAGEYLCERRALPPQRLHSMVSRNLSFLTAATFFRRRVVAEHGLLFDPQWRDVGDADWTLRLLDRGVRTAVLGEFTSVFSETGSNCNLAPNATREKAALTRRAPAWARAAAPLIVAHYRLRRLVAGHYRCRPLDYAIYSRRSPERRQVFHAAHPTYRWRRPQTSAATDSLPV